MQEWTGMALVEAAAASLRPGQQRRACAGRATLYLATPVSDTANPVITSSAVTQGHHLPFACPALQTMYREFHHPTKSQKASTKTAAMPKTRLKPPR